MLAATKITQIISSVYDGSSPMVSLLIQRSHTAFSVWWYLVQMDGISPKAEYKQLARQIGFQDRDGAVRTLGQGWCRTFLIGLAAVVVASWQRKPVDGVTGERCQWM